MIAAATTPIHTTYLRKVVISLPALYLLPLLRTLVRLVLSISPVSNRETGPTARPRGSDGPGRTVSGVEHAIEFVLRE